MRMTLFKRPLQVDKSPFQTAQQRSTLYGLPREVKYCRECIISNQRPSSAVEFKNNGNNKKSIQFNDEGICDACLVKRNKKQINWKEREQQLRTLCDRHRSSDGSYDCLVPGSGGKDSIMQAHLLKYKYGMNPLTCTWAPNIYTDWGWKNHQAWIHAGFDNILFTPNGKIHRILTRVSLERLLHPFQPFFLGQKNLAPKIAEQYGISLIFFGENEAEYGNSKNDNNQPTRSSEFFTAPENETLYIGGATLEELSEMGIQRGQIAPYLPVSKDRVRDKGIEVHYLGYYEKWHPQGAFYYAVENAGFIPAPERSAGSYSKYNSIDDKIDDFHFHTYYTKFGIGRATYDASQEIRSGDLLREEGVALVNKYDGEFPNRWADEIFSYLSLPPEEFPLASKAFEEPLVDRHYYDLLCERFRSPHLWDYSDEQGWLIKNKVKNIESNDHEDRVASWVGNRAN